MRRAFLAIVAVLLVSCAPKPAEPLSWSDAARPHTIDVDAAALTHAREIGARVTTILSGADPTPLSQFVADPVLQEAMIQLSHGGLDLQLDPLAPFAGGFLADLGAEGLGSRRVTVWIGDDDSRGWRMHLAAPLDRLRAPRLVSERTRISLDPTNGELTGDAELAIDTAGERVLPIYFDDPTTAGATLVEVSQDGAPLRFVRTALNYLPVVFVETGKPASRARLRIRWRARPVGRGGSAYLFPDEALLEGFWVPMLPQAGGDLDLVVEHPEDYPVFGEGRASERATRPRSPGGGDGARVETRFRVALTHNTTLFGGTRYVMKTADVGGHPVTVAIWSEDAAHLDRVADALGAAWKALSPLGPFPEKLRVVECGYVGGTTSIGGDGFIGLGFKTVERSELKSVLLQTTTHEMAHGWLGGAVHGCIECSSGGAWPETLAEYVSTWALTDDLADEHRAQWASWYRADPGADAALMTVRRLGVGEEPLLYAKGPLLMTALEDRIGRPKTCKAIARFIADRDGQPSTWTDFLTAMREVDAGDGATWLERWLDRPGAPDLALKDVQVADGRLTATLTQTSNPPFDGTVELGFADEIPVDAVGRVEHPLGLTRVDFGKASVPIAIEVPAGAKWIVIDPRCRLPWKAARQQRVVRF